MENRKRHGHHTLGVGHHFISILEAKLRLTLSDSLEFVDIEELCAHGVQFGGMCVNCGKDMTEYAFYFPIPYEAC